LVSLLTVPLVFGSDAIGVLTVYTGQPHRFSNEEVRILTALADLSALAIEKARLYERIVDVEEQMRTNEKLSALGLLAAEVAHEIRNPLTVMKMLYHSLGLCFPEDDPRARDAQIMGEKMEHLNRIVERILDFARTSEPEFAAVNLRGLIEDLSLLTHHKFKQQGIKVRIDIPPDLPAVRADATQLSQAFLNLVLNAMEAMPDGGRLTIAARVLAKGAAPGSGPCVGLTFRDSGRGMSQEQQSRLFTSLLSTTKTKGTGLGLAIVARIIEAHQGHLLVKSQPGRGTTWRITLPLYAPLNPHPREH
jgi:signal transduction histidine kinase